MTIRRRHLLSTAGATLLPLPALGQAAATPPGGREALLMPGKRTLRQRVLTRPGAGYRAQPGPARQTPRKRGAPASELQVNQGLRAQDAAA